MLRLSAVVGLFLILAPATAAAQAADMYLKFEGVDGEALDAEHKEWIDILSIDWGAAGDPAAQGNLARPRRAGAAAGARRRADVKMDDITISKGYDKASPKLLEACARGAHIPKVDVYLMRSSDGRYLKYELKNVMVTSYSMSSAGEGTVPTESVTLNFADVKWEYAETDRHGAEAGVLKGEVKGKS